MGVCTMRATRPPQSCSSSVSPSGPSWASWGGSTTAMAARYQHMVDAVRADVARQVDGLIWKLDETRREGEN